MLEECKQKSNDEQKSYEDTLFTYVNQLTTCNINLDAKDAECKSKIEHANAAYKSDLETLKNKYELIKQKHTDCENRIATIQQEHNTDNERAAKTCAENVHHWTKREHDCKNQKNDLKLENEELKKQLGKKSNGSQSTSNTSIIICVLIILLLLGLCIYLYFFKR
jgi:flagellar basal body-associated protein FliL